MGMTSQCQDPDRIMDKFDIKGRDGREREKK